MFTNATPFAGLAVPGYDDRGAEAVVVLAKATFLRRGAGLALADDQVPVRLADVPTGPAAIEEGR
jgi:hypothetical protein